MGIPEQGQVLGGHEFEFNPTKMTPPEEQIAVADQPTYEGSAIFNWGPLLQGVQVTLEWDGMSEVEYQALRTIYLLGDVVVWNLGQPLSDGNSEFSVFILSFSGDYIDKMILYNAHWRINCKMVLDIRGVVS